MLERMLAVFQFLVKESNIYSSAGGRKDKRKADRAKDEVAGSADVLTAISTLASLRLIGKVGNVVSGVDLLDGGSKYRVNVSWEVVRSVGRSVGVEIEDFIAE